jgi:hypothetical protein
MYKSKLTGSIVAILLVTGMAACNNAKSPQTVANDVATARQKAATEVANAEQSAAKKDESAQSTVDQKAQDLNSTEAKGAYDVATAKADGDHKIALEKCLALAGDAQKACKDKADANYDLAKANAKATLASQKPQ